MVPVFGSGIEPDQHNKKQPAQENIAVKQWYGANACVFIGYGQQRITKKQQATDTDKKCLLVF
ncbi:MAG TPA: hypothetical protein VIK80_09575 [Flavihumibacter sp.]